MNRSSGVLLLAAASLVMTTITSAPSYADKQYGNFLVKGKIQQEYERTGGPGKWGNPTIAESNADRNGKFQRFEKFTSFYWQANVSGGKANQIGGSIRDKWGSDNYERGTLGFPTTNEISLPRFSGAYNNFEYGSIYWEGRSGLGAHFVYPGKIRDGWAIEGYEGSYPLPGQTGHEAFGYPQSDPYRVDDGQQQDFEHGKIRYVPANNALEIRQTGEFTDPLDAADTKYSSYLGDRERTKCIFRGSATFYNGSVYVTDTCDDNINMVGRVAWKSPDGTVQNRYCIGGLVNVTQRCQFVLSEAQGSGTRVITAGLETDPGGEQPQYGNAVPFNVQ